MPPDPNPPPPDEWNLLPDPTTGQVDVYHQGGYVGSVTGKEPADENPASPASCSARTTSSEELILGAGVTPAEGSINPPRVSF